MEKNKLKMNHNIKTEKNKNQKIRIIKSLDTNENRKKHNYQLHPKPEKPIDYLKEIMKGKKGNKRIEKKDEGVGDMLAELKDHNHTIKGRNQIIDTLDMIKSKTTAIDQKDKKVLLLKCMVGRIQILKKNVNSLENKDIWVLKYSHIMNKL